MKQTTEKKVLLDCRDVSLGYEGKAIWEGLSFQVRSGDYLCIVGENGSGKSTLLKSLLGLLRPMKGDIVLDASLRAGAIGYLPQQTRAQKDFPATVTEVVRSGFLSGKRGRFFYTPGEKSSALMHMGKLGILELKDRCYRELSGGQQQRVLLARAICQEPNVLLLDEPLTSFDVVVADEMKALLRRIKGQHIILLSTHIMDLALDLCDDIVILHHGVLQEVRREDLADEAYKDRIIAALKEEPDVV